MTPEGAAKQLARRAAADRRPGRERAPWFLGATLRVVATVDGAIDCDGGKYHGEFALPREKR